MPVHIFASRSSPPQFPPSNQPFFPARFHAPLPPLQVSVSPPGSHSPRPVFPPVPPSFPNSPAQAIFSCSAPALAGAAPAGPQAGRKSTPLPRLPRSLARRPLHTSPPPPPTPAAGNSRRRFIPPGLPIGRPAFAPASQQAGRQHPPPPKSCRPLPAPYRAGHCRHHIPCLQ